MATLRRILLVTQWTDFDAGAERAALALAQKLGTGLNVVVPLLSNPEFEVVAPELAAEAEAKAGLAATEFSRRAQSAAVPLEVNVRRGDEPWAEVVDEARAEKADLLVTRRRGHRSFMGRLRVGEMVRQIAAQAPCPTLMVPRAALLPTQRVLAVIETGAAFVHVARTAARMASALDLPLELVAAVATGSATALGAAALKQAEDVVQAAGIRCDGIVLSGELVALVPEHMRQRQADLIVIGIPPQRAAHGRLGDTVETLVAEVPCPTLLVGAVNAS